MSLVRTLKSLTQHKSSFRISSSLTEKFDLVNPPAKPAIRPDSIYKKLSDQLTICRMNAKDIHYAMSTWALQEKWASTHYSMEAFHDADPEGYFMLFNEGDPIASISAVRYPELKVAYIGLFLVEASMRNKGYSKILWDNVIPQLTNEGYALGLNASPYASLAKPDFYAKLGFIQGVTDEAWQLKDIIPLDAPALAGGVEIVPVTDDLMDEVIAYDTRILGANRKDFTDGWIRKPDTITFAALTDGKVTGYIVASTRILATEPDKKSYRLGPLYADNQSCASGLMYNALKAIKEARPVVIDLPGNNLPNATQVMKTYGFSFFYNSIQMSTAPKPTENNDQVYAKTSLAIAPR